MRKMIKASEIIKIKNNYIKAMCILMRGQFMQPDIDELNKKRRAFSVETNEGTIFGHEGFEPDSDIESWDLEYYSQGYLVRMSAPGYLDATDWTYCESLYEVIDWLQDECTQAGLDVDELPECQAFDALSYKEKRSL